MENFKQILALAAGKAVSKKPFYITEKQSYSYGDFIERVGKINTLFRKNGLVPGDRIMVSISNDYDMFCVTFSLILNGATAVLIEPDSKSKRAEVIINASGINGCIVDSEHIPNWNLHNYQLLIGLEEELEKRGMLLKKLLKKKDDEEVRQTLNYQIESLDSSMDLPNLSLEQEAVIIFTSGTTSSPKGVLLSHRNLLAHLATLSKQYQLDKDAVLSNILPLYHVDGLFQGPLLAFYNQITLSRPFHFEVQKIDELLHTVYKHRVTHFFCVPTMLALINQFSAHLQDSFETEYFKYVISSAGYLDSSLWQSFMDNFNVRIINVYGLTETVAGGFFCGPTDDTWRMGSIGKPADIQALLIDENSIPVNKGEIGEILIKGDSVMNAYLIPSENPDKDGWFHTGDLAYQDEDGFYFIKGRKKSVIIKGGINIYPEEVTETLLIHDDIVEAFVYGESDDIWGEKTIAALVMSLKSTIDVQGIFAYCREHLQLVNVPDEIYFLDCLPKGKSGKIAIEQVRSKVAAIEQSNVTDDSLSLKMGLIKIASECFGTSISEDKINAPSQSIHGWNSLEHLHFVSEIEKTYNIELSTRDIMNITSISSAISIVSNKLGNQ